MHNQSDHEQQAILAGLAAAAAMMTIAIAFALASGCKARDADDEQPATVAEERDDEQVEQAETAELAEQPEQEQQQPRTVSDAGISEAVERELRLDPAISAAQLEVNTIDGVVALTGTVDNLLAKQRATLIAEHVKGVRSVSNRLELRAAERELADQTLAKDVREALLYDPAAESYEVEVSVADAVVTLDGTVDSWPERQLAERVASSVRGVKQIDNQLAVEPPKQRIDSEILADIRARLRWDVLVDHEPIAVEVEDGRVTLSGTVGSAAERRRAHADAWTAGVVHVDSEQLEVAWYRDGTELREPRAQRVSPEQIRDAILDAAAYDPRVFSFDIDVEVVGTSSVTLRGTVDNLEAKQAAEQLARNTVGVAHVVNHIEVRPKPGLSDADVEQRIESQLRTNVHTEAYEIDVHVENGVVTLTGTVDSYLEKADAGDVAAGARGVIDVNNKLQVEHQELGYFFDPYLYPYDPYVYPWQTYAPSQTELSDVQIEDDIEFELFWSPFVNAGEVEVEVRGGTATLTGTVDSWRERAAAEQQAYEGGALFVDNLLHVDLP